MCKINVHVRIRTNFSYLMLLIGTFKVKFNVGTAISLGFDVF